MSSSAEERMNLATLQRSDPYIRRIKATAKHVTLYTFKPATNEWEKTDTEGTCFVYERSAKPYYGFIILNRLGRNNFIEALTGTLEFQLQAPFLLYRNPPCIYGLWFYNDQECKAMNELLSGLVKLTRDGQKPAPSPEVPVENLNLVSTDTSASDVDILQLLSKAQNAYNTAASKKPEPPSVTSQPKQDVMLKPHPVKPNIPATGPVSIDDLFRKASSNRNQTGNSDASNGNTIADTENHAFKKLLPTSQVTTVTELEREHTPELSDHVLLTPASLSANLATPVKSLQNEDSQSELMSPMAFSIGKRKIGGRGGDNPIPVAINPPQHVNITDALRSGFSQSIGRIPRTVSQSSDPVPLEPDTLQMPASSLDGVNPLTKDQLKQALIHLLHNDQGFLQDIHSAYVSSLNVSLRR